MGRADEIINFLFRSLKGRLVLIACTAFIAMMCSGCFLCSCPGAACANADCEVGAECFFGCNDVCIDACGDSCGGCGDSCAASCLDNNDDYGYIDAPAGSNGCCGGCDDEDEEPAGSDGCCGGDEDEEPAGSDGCCGGCDDEEPTLDYSVRFLAFDSEGNYIETLSTQYASITESDAEDMTTIPCWGSIEWYGNFFAYEGAFLNFNSTTGELTDQVAGRDGTVSSGDVLLNNSTFYVKLTEQASVGEDYTLYFDVSEYSSQTIEPLDVRVGEVMTGFPSSKDFPALQDGRVIVGWSTTPNGEVLHLSRNIEFHPYKLKVPDLDITLYPCYGKAVFNVVFYVNDYRYTFNLNPGETLENYIYQLSLNGGYNTEFIGWAFNETNYKQGKVDLYAAMAYNYEVYENMTLYAVFRDYGESIEIRFHNTKGPNPPDDIKTVQNYAGESVTLEKPTSNQGPYEFAGWFSSSTFELGTEVTGSIVISKDGPTDYYAKWTEVANNEIVYHVSQDGSSYFILHRATYTYSQTNRTPLMPLTVDNIPTGYTFAGWRKDGPDNNNPVMTSLPAGAFGKYELYAVYRSEGYEVRLFPEGGTISSMSLVADSYYESSVSFGDRMQFPVPVKRGHTFLGWYRYGTETRVTDEDGLMLDKHNENGGLVLQAKWQILTFTVRFVNGTDNYVSPVTVDYGTKVPSAPDTTPAPPSDGYEFSHWADANGNRYSSNTTVTKDITYTAKFVAREFTITLELPEGATLEGGGTTKTIKVHYGDTNINLGKAIGSSLTQIFNGWKIKGTSDSARVTGPNGLLTSYAYTSDITLVAVFT